jgi:hypothetical protein
MKTILLLATILCVFAARAHAQFATQLEDDLTRLWIQKSYSSISELLDAKNSATPPDVLALSSSTFFYVFVQPNRVKALAAAEKLKMVANSTNDPAFINFSNVTYENINQLPEASFAPSTPEALDAWRIEFPESFPNLDFGARLRRFVSP